VLRRLAQFSRMRRSSFDNTSGSSLGLPYHQQVASPARATAATLIRDTNDTRRDEKI
jgi:hypothetical protein